MLQWGRFEMDYFLIFAFLLIFRRHPKVRLAQLFSWTSSIKLQIQILRFGGAFRTAGKKKIKFFYFY